MREAVLTLEEGGGGEEVVSASRLRCSTAGAPARDSRSLGEGNLQSNSNHNHSLLPFLPLLMVLLTTAGVLQSLHMVLLLLLARFFFFHFML